MTHATDNSIDSADGPGIQLRRAREARGMDIVDIAQELHLDTWIIEALEEDDFAALGAPVFAKGHMRQYGSLLGLPTDDLMIAYYRVRGRDDAPPAPITATMTRPAANRNVAWAAIVLAVIVLGGLAGLLWFMSDRPLVGGNTDEPEPAPAEVVPPSSLDPGLAVDVVLDLPADSGAADALQTGASEFPADTGDTAVDAADDSPATNTPPPLPVSGDTFELTLRFSDRSWVEVSDPGGRIIYGIFEAGSSRSVSAEAPVELYFGLVGAVEVVVNGQPYA
ncbi:MAG: DUF4115 domain-containing protein, partial [Gammaproteobacteria bacterium]|nr:DUF4115 domain-containing protein [Gammaproteobacteria bacterium]